MAHHKVTLRELRSAVSSAHVRHGDALFCLLSEEDRALALCLFMGRPIAAKSVQSARRHILKQLRALKPASVSGAHATNSSGEPE